MFKATLEPFYLKSIVIQSRLQETSIIRMQSKTVGFGGKLFFGQYENLYIASQS
jgi:hypothetical protein